MSSLKVGDIVRLKSGGPKMTVISCSSEKEEPRVWCSWFTLHYEYSPNATVKHEIWNGPLKESFTTTALAPVE